MGMRYRLPASKRLRLLTGSGSVSVIAEERDDIEVEPPDRHSQLKDEVLEIHSKSGSVRVRCPVGTRISVGVISGSVRLEGTFGSVKVSAISGSIHVDSATGDVDIRSVSGSLSVGRCGGECTLNTKSGRISVGHVEKAIHAATISGTVELSTAGQGDVEVRTISGGVTVRVSQGRHPHPKFRTLSGRIRCDCPEGDDFDIKATTLSGSIEITGT